MIDAKMQTIQVLFSCQLACGRRRSNQNEYFLVLVHKFFLNFMRARREKKVSESNHKCIPIITIFH